MLSCNVKGKQLIGISHLSLCLIRQNDRITCSLPLSGSSQYKLLCLPLLLCSLKTIEVEHTISHLCLGGGLSLENNGKSYGHLWIVILFFINFLKSISLIAESLWPIRVQGFFSWFFKVRGFNRFFHSSRFSQGFFHGSRF